jgi:predicted unusual protein kinase regulating ubiquinone biosynthesis (AarF/ABC1/UbiB family)
VASSDDPDAKRRLLSRIADRRNISIPTTSLGRLRRTATAALRVGADQLLRRLSGDEGLDAETLQRVVLSLGELKGIAMKMGQVLSYVETPFLTAQARELFAVLQRQAPQTSFREVEATLREAFGARADALLATLEREPVAAASIGQVHRARLPDGTPVAVKVRHPGIEAAIRADFRSAQTGKALAQLLAPGAEVDEVIAEARERFLEECNYELERRRQQRFIEIFRTHPTISIPAVHEEWCSPRVLTTTWREGQRLEEFQSGATQSARDRAGEALYEFYIGTLYRHGLFNADPHPGNLLFREDGSVAILDHGCVREFDRQTVLFAARLSNAVREDRRGGIVDALRQLGAKAPEDDASFEVTRGLLRGFYQPTLEHGPRRMRGDVTLEARQVLASKRAMLRLRLPGRLLFLFRIRFGLHSVLARVGAVLDWRALEERFTTEALARAEG